MTHADYHPYLPRPDQSRIAGEDSRSHATGRLATHRARDLFRQWEILGARPFVGITTSGEASDGLFTLGNDGAPAEEMAAAAFRLLDRLHPDDRARAQHPVGSSLWRRWQNTEIFVESHGLRLDEAADPIPRLVLEIVRASLSDVGYANTVSVMQLNGFLGMLLNAPQVLGEWSYNFCLFGTPSTIEPWGWQLWGHHLSVSCLIIGGQMVLTPCFLGAEICYADRGPHAGLTAFQDHERLGLELMNSLPEAARRQALVGRSLSGEDLPDGRLHFADYLMLGGAYQDNRIVPYEGVAVSQFAAGHRNRLLDLVDAYIGMLPDGPRGAKMEQFVTHLEHSHFCWIGGTGPDDPFYYRIQSPVVFIEFDHHPGLFLTNREALKYHVHTIVRTPNGNDYGIDLLRQHYRHAH